MAGLRHSQALHRSTASVPPCAGAHPGVHTAEGVQAPEPRTMMRNEREQPCRRGQRQAIVVPGCRIAGGTCVG